MDEIGRDKEQRGPQGDPQQADEWATTPPQEHGQIGSNGNNDSDVQAETRTPTSLKRWTGQDWVTAVATVMIFITTAVYTYYARKQWQEMKSSGSDTHDLAVAAGKQAGAAKVQSEQAQSQTDKMAESLKKTDALIRQATDQTKATNSLAREAKRSADSAAGSLDAVRANFYRDQRPWAFIERFHLSSEPEENKETTIQCFVSNTGKSPAMDVVPQSRPLIWNVEPPMTSFVLIEPARSRMILPPGTSGTALNVSFTTDPWIIPKESIEAYSKGTALLYVHIKLWYADAYGRPHWTTVCAIHAHGKPLDEWIYCALGNGVDHESEQAGKPN